MAGLFEKISALITPKTPQQNTEGSLLTAQESKFHQSVRNGNLGQVHSEVNRGFDINAKNI